MKEYSFRHIKVQNAYHPIIPSARLLQHKTKSKQEESLGYKGEMVIKGPIRKRTIYTCVN